MLPGWPLAPRGTIQRELAQLLGCRSQRHVREAPEVKHGGGRRSVDSRRGCSGSHSGHRRCTRAGPSYQSWRPAACRSRHPSGRGAGPGAPPHRGLPVVLGGYAAPCALMQKRHTKPIYCGKRSGRLNPPGGPEQSRDSGCDGLVVCTAPQAHFAAFASCAPRRSTSARPPTCARVGPWDPRQHVVPGP